MIQLNEAKELKIGDVLYHKILTNYDKSPAEFVVVAKPLTKKDKPNFVHVKLKHGMNVKAVLINDERMTYERNNFYLPLFEFEKTKWAFKNNILDSYHSIDLFLKRGIKDINNPPKTIDPCNRPVPYGRGSKNTRVVRIDCGKVSDSIQCNAVGIKYHDTIIVTYYFHDNVIKLNTDGWKTSSTRERMNSWQNRFNVYTQNHIMYLSYYDKTYLYEDNMHLFPNGEVKLNNTIVLPVTKKELKQKEKLKKDVDKYVDKFIDKFMNCEIPKQSACDCFKCLTNSFNKYDVHILEHIDESYYVPSLLVNAINSNEKIGIYRLSTIDESNIVFAWNNKKGSMYFTDITKKRLKLILKRYINRHVGLGVT